MFVAGSQELILCDKMPSYKSQNKVLLYLSPSSLSLLLFPIRS